MDFIEILLFVIELCCVVYHKKLIIWFLRISCHPSSWTWFLIPHLFQTLKIFLWLTDMVCIASVFIQSIWCWNAGKYTLPPLANFTTSITLICLGCQHAVRVEYDKMKAGSLNKWSPYLTNISDPCASYWIQKMQ